MLSVAGPSSRGPERERTPPSHRYKWYKMMGAADLLPKTQRKGTPDGPGHLRPQ